MTFCALTTVRALASLMPACAISYLHPKVPAQDQLALCGRSSMTVQVEAACASLEEFLRDFGRRLGHRDAGLDCRGVLVATRLRSGLSSTSLRAQ